MDSSWKRLGKNMKKLFALLLVLSACGSVDDPIVTTTQAFDTLTYNPPFKWGWPSPTVEAYVGLYDTDHKQYLVYRRVSTGECEKILISTSTSEWPNNVIVNLSGKADYAYSVGHDDPVYINCTNGGGFPLGDAHHFSATLTFNGLEGADTIVAGGDYTVANGGEGDDLLMALSPYASLNGNNGNDRLITQRSLAGQTQLNGGEGNDCLQWIPSGTDPAPVRLCGNGVDKYTGSSFNASYCETPVGGCY